ncbi:MAG TPA: type 1 glutamine amidotransferase [Bacillota bacterium]|nr:type 1 glutamine amidotransferase [Bacillota bacterium]
MRILVCKHVPHEGLGYFGQLLDERQVVVDYQELYEDDQPRDLKTYQGLIVMGGPMNVYEENSYPFLKTSLRYIESAINLGLPYLGFCLGAQLLARVLGAKVYKNSRPELGWYPISVTETGSLFRGCPTNFRVFQWHEDTFELPVDSRMLATGDSCRNQAFFWKDYAFGLQFHLELDEKSIRQWLQNEITEVWGFDKVAIIADTQKYVIDAMKVGSQMIANYLKLIAKNEKEKRN